MTEDSEVRKSPLRYGIDILSCTPEVLNDILGIYCRVVQEDEKMTPDDLLAKPSMIYRESIRKRINPIREWRFGSHLTAHSKLWIEQRAMFGGVLITFRCSANLGREVSSFEEGEKMEQDFKVAVDTYLQEKSLAVPIPY